MKKKNLNLLKMSICYPYFYSTVAHPENYIRQLLVINIRIITHLARIRVREVQSILISESIVLFEGRCGFN